MRRFADRVYICYDGDFAGQAATLRGLEILDGEGLDVRVVSLPDGLDPDDFVKKYGPVGMRDAMEKAYTLMEFKLEMLRRELDMESENGRMEFGQAGNRHGAGTGTGGSRAVFEAHRTDDRVFHGLFTAPDL